MATRVVNLTKTSFTFYIGRPGSFGNPFYIGRDGTRDEVIEKYRDYLRGHPEIVIAAREHLRDKVLGCYCKPLACHGDVLARVADGGEI